MKQYRLTLETVRGEAFDNVYDDDYEAICDARDMIDEGFESEDDGCLTQIQSLEIVESETSGGMIVSEQTIYKYEVTTTYAPDKDITFIMADTREGNNHKEEVIGFYHGGADEYSTDAYIGQLVAFFEGFYKDKK